MKKYLIIALIILVQINVQAQNERQIKGYTKNVEIKVDANTVIVSEVGQLPLLTAKLIAQNGLVNISKSDSVTFMQILALTPDQLQSLDQQYEKDFPKVSITTKILSRAKQLGKLNFTPIKPNSGTATNGDDPLAYEQSVAAQTNIEKKETNNWPWITSIVVALLSGLMIGGIIAKNVWKKKIAIKSTAPTEPTKAQTIVINEANDLKKINEQQLQQIDAIRAQNLKKENEHKQIIQLLDANYFAPFNKALEQGNPTEIISKGLQAVLVANAYNANILGKQTQNELNNFNKLINNETNTATNVVNNDTLKDKVSVTLQAVMDIMNTHQIKSLNGITIQNTIIDLN